MSKLTLEFTLPEETEEMRTAVNAGNMRSAVVEFDSFLRGVLKYDTHPYLDNETVEKVRTILHECLNNNDAGALF